MVFHLLIGAETATHGTPAMADDLQSRPGRETFAGGQSGETAMHPEWELSDDRKSVTLRIPAEPAIDLTFGTAELDELLDGLGRYRAAMIPPVPEKPADDPMATTIKDTTIAVEQADSGVVFHIRDPRFAWLRYSLPLDAAQALGATLANLSENPAAGSGSNTIN